MSNTILIVDDSKHIRKQLEIYLKSENYSNLLFADSVQEAFKLLKMETPEAVSSSGVGLILMDFNMPTINGVEACRRIKAVKHLKDIPIIMITAYNIDDKLQSTFDAGTVYYIKKPLDKVELIARISSLLKPNRSIDKQNTL